MKKSNIIIAKVGGKILENSDNLKSTITQFQYLLNEVSEIKKIIIIPGGGTLANFVRSLDHEFRLGDDLAHWSAIYAMNQNGLEICKKFSDLKCIKNFEKLVSDCYNQSIKLFCVFLPYFYLKETDELPHSWSVTSDSIAIYFASKLKLNKCFLIKNIDGLYIKNQRSPIQEISTKEYEALKKSNRLKQIESQSKDLKKSKPIDLYSHKLINDFKISCIMLNGSLNSNRILEFFDEQKSEKEKIYTEIHS